MKKKSINKRLGREIKEDWVRYFALFALITIGVMVVVSIAGASEAILKTVADYNEEANIQSGEFVTMVPLTDNELEKLEDEGSHIEKKFSVDVEEKSYEIRIFKEREEINKLKLEQGNDLKKQGQIILEKHFADQRDKKIGDHVKLGGKKFEVVGIGCIPDYNMVKKEISDVNADAEKFGWGIVTEEDYDQLKESDATNKAETYQYAYTLDEDVDADRIRDSLMEMEMSPEEWQGYLAFNAGTPLPTGQSAIGSEKDMPQKLVYLTKNEDNARIKDYKDDTLINRNTVLVVGVFVFLLIAYVISTFVINRIENDRKIIGTLMALGYRRGELIRHFILSPVIISLSGGVVGTILGFAIELNQTGESADYYSYPPVEQAFPLYLIIYGVVLPTLVALLVNYFLLRRKLNVDPQSLLRKVDTYHEKGKVKSVKGKFINYLAVKQLFRETRANVVMFFGLFISVLLLVFAFTIYSCIENLEEDVLKDVKFENMYVLKYPTGGDVEDGEEGYLKKLKSYNPLANQDLEISLQGIEKESEYFDFDVSDTKENEVYISTSAQQKYGWKKGDRIVLDEKGQDVSYGFKVKGVVPYSNGIYVFMDLEKMQSLFNQADDSYNVVFSKKELDLEKQGLLSVTKREDISRTAKIFMNMMKGLIIMVLACSIVMFVAVIYLLLQMMIDKSRINISLLKILGYRNGEIKRIYMGGSLMILALVIVVGIPISKKIVDAIYPSLVTNVASGFRLELSWDLYGIIIAIIITAYIVVTALLNRKVRSISASEILRITD